MKTILAVLLCLPLTLAAAKDKMPKLVTMEDLQAQQRVKSIALAQTRVSDAMKDPDSAKFRNVVSTVEGAFIFGEVNAKNSMGGYSGYTRFYTNTLSMLSIESDSMSDGEHGVFDKMWERCAK